MATFQSQAYLSMQVKTSDRMEIIISLYESMLSAIAQAMEAAESGNVVRKGERITKAAEILLTLCESLDYSQPGNLAGTLLAVYNGYLRQLLEANRTNNIVMLQAVHSGLSILLDGWKQVANSPEAQELRRADFVQKRKAPTMEIGTPAMGSLALTA